MRLTLTDLTRTLAHAASISQRIGVISWIVDKSPLSDPAHVSTMYEVDTRTGRVDICERRQWCADRSLFGGGISGCFA